MGLVRPPFFQKPGFSGIFPAPKNDEIGLYLALISRYFPGLFTFYAAGDFFT
jgi:hypothetical protein